MFKVSWDKNTGGVKLSSKVLPNTLGVSPRPVFYEELDLLKINEFGWKYPHCDEPIMWACNKQYFYRGELAFEVKGANIYDPPTVILHYKKNNLSLKPVDVKKMMEVCKDEMFLIESEAIEFIRNTYIQYSLAKESVKSIEANQVDFDSLALRLEKKEKRPMAIIKQDCDSFDIMPLQNAKEQGKRIYQTTYIDRFLASFSGGKDSQVLLDLCTRAIPPTSFDVIYSDTGYELPTSLKLYEEVKEYYKKRFPELKFYTARNHESVLTYWDKIGTPSDTHRWCCSVMKTAPLYRMLKIEGSNKQGRILTFDGVRAEESTRRSNYERIGKGVKHATVINASPLLNWNTTEIFLYIFKYDLILNQSYRQGMTRVGCLICPFSSDWNDMISNTCYHTDLKPFLSRIEKIILKSEVQDVKNYIKNGNWKRRGGGRGISFPSFMEIISTKPDLKIRCLSAQKNILTWLYAVGDYTIYNSKIIDNKIVGEIIYEKNIYKFAITKKEKEQLIVFENTSALPVFQGLLKRALYKATYCLNCESCEVECPTGALTILPEPIIDNKKCTHCHKCLMFHDFGCIVANSLHITGNDSKNNNMKLISYNNFGLREDWLDMYLSSYSTYFTDNSHGLNPKEQMPSFIKWVIQAEIMDDSKNKGITAFGKLLSDLYRDMPDLVWEIVWINLSYNSPIAKWYKESIDWGLSFTQQDIQELVKIDYSADSPTTIKNIVYALFRTLKESPIGAMGLLTEIDKLYYKKVPYNDLSREAVAYSLFKYSEQKGIKSFRVADLYASDNKQGVFREFGISKTNLLKQLRSLNSDTNRILIAELNMGLDHISLREDLDSAKVLSILTSLR